MSYESMFVLGKRPTRPFRWRRGSRTSTGPFTVSLQVIGFGASMGYSAKSGIWIEVLTPWRNWWLLGTR